MTEIGWAAWRHFESGAVKGALAAEGTALTPLLLHAREGENGNSWYGVVVDAAARSVTLTHVAIEAANNAVTSAAPGAILKIESSALRHNYTGIWLSAGSPLLDGLLLADNAIAGVYAEAKTADLSLTLVNSVARLNGSYGVFVTAGAARTATVNLQSSTLYGNTSSGGTCKANGSGAHVTLAITDSIVAVNGILGVDSSALDGGVASATTTYSDLFSNGEDFSGAVAGTGCISADPAFIDAPGDLRLAAGSPCIDAGTTDGAPTTDLQGRRRPQGAAIDLGAYEYEPNDVAIVPSGGAGAAGAPAAAGAETEAAGGAAHNTVDTEGGRLAAPTDGGRGDTPGGAPPRVTSSDTENGCSCGLVGGARWNGVALGLTTLGLALLRRRRRRTSS